MTLTLKTEIKNLAAKIGFPIFGIAPAQIDDIHRQRYLKWIASNRHAKMEYLAKRRDIHTGLQSVLPGIKSVLVFGLPYKHQDLVGNKEMNTKFAGKVSLYATGRDYHRIFEKGLKKIARLLSEHDDSPKFYVDYGPVLERAYANRAGLGFFGKNNCLINSHYGSYFFIGVILSKLEFDYDSPLELDCEDCEMCIKSCSTNALKSAYNFDANLCRSYQTVENKGEIPVLLRDKMDGWILGCDMCQQVCPYNKRASESMHPDIINQRLSSRMELAQFFEMDDTEFKVRFMGNAAMRPGRLGMMRNAAIAAVNLNCTELLPVLQKSLNTESDQNLKMHLLWAISRLEG